MIFHKKIHKITSTIKLREESLATPFWISPDQTKIIYLHKELENNKEQWNLYAAKIIGDTFSNKVCIAKDVNLTYDVQWKDDSKSILFFTEKDTQDKQEINLVTFK